MAETNNKIIRQISTDANNTYDIAAKYLSDASNNDYTYETIVQKIDDAKNELLDVAHGVIDTYVIASSKKTNNKTIYESIVESNASILENVNVSDLDKLVSPSRPENVNYHVGDIILMEAKSDGNKIFDRWISAVNGDKVNLAVFETQVATHHHTIGVSTSKALTGFTPTNTATIPVVGDAVNVVTSVTNIDSPFLTSVSLSGGNTEITLTSNSGSGSVGHSHTIASHTHTVTIKPSDLVGSNASAYTSLTSANHTPHTHESETVAAVAVASTPFKYVNGGSTDTAIKTLKDSNETTGSNSKALVTNANTDGTSTSTQVSGENTGDDVVTAQSGNHTHTVSVTTGSSVVTSVDLAPKVVTSVSFNAGTVQTKVVTGITTSSTTAATSWTNNVSTASFLNSFTCSVNPSGVLSFVVSSANAVTEAIKITASKTIKYLNVITSQNQSAASLDVDDVEQSFGTNSVSLGVTVGESGAHSHGFTHTHTIESHTHGIESHTHSYKKSVQDATVQAYTSLTSANHTPHTHGSETVAAVAVASTPFKYVNGGSTTSVVENLSTTDKIYTTSSKELSTDTKYYKIEGEIEFPAITGVSVKISTSTSDITPASTGTEMAIKSITFTSNNFVTGLTSGSDKTSTNVGGE